MKKKNLVILEGRGKIYTSHDAIKQMIQTEKETIREDQISEEVGTGKLLVDTVRERGNTRP